MIVLQRIPADVRVLGKTQVDSIRFHILNQVVCYRDVIRQQRLIETAPNPVDAGIVNLAIPNGDALRGGKRNRMIF
jgi:hypothetical protein